MTIIFTSLRVAIADNSQFIISNLKIALRDMGFSDRLITSFKHSKNLLSFLRENTVDILIIDSDFSGENNGNNILEEIKQHQLLNRSTITILLSSNPNKTYFSTFIGIDPDIYLLKPFSLYDFKKHLKQMQFRKQKFSEILNYDLSVHTNKFITLCDKLIQVYPNEKKYIYRLMVSRLFEQKKFKEAYYYSKRVIDEKSYLWPSFIMLWSMLEMNHPGTEHHLVYLENEGYVFDDCAKIWELKTILFLRKNNIENAYKCIKEAYNLNKNSTVYCLARARISELMGNTSEALKYYERYNFIAKNTYDDNRDDISVFRLKIDLMFTSLVEINIKNDKDYVKRTLKIHRDMLKDNHVVPKSFIIEILSQKSLFRFSMLYYWLYIFYKSHHVDAFKFLYKFTQSITHEKKCNLLEKYTEQRLLTDLSTTFRQEIQALNIMDTSVKDNRDEIYQSLITLMKNNFYSVQIRRNFMHFLVSGIPGGIDFEELKQWIISSKQLIINSLGLSSYVSKEDLGIVRAAIENFRQIQRNHD